MGQVPPPPAFPSTGGAGGGGWPDETGGSFGSGTGGSFGAGGAGGAGSSGGTGGTFGGGLDGGWSSSVGGVGGSTTGAGGTTGTAGSSGGYFETDAGMPVEFVVPTGPAAADKCANAPKIPMTSNRINLPISTTTAGPDLPSPCAGSGADVFYSFLLSVDSVVYADSFGSSWNTVIYFASSCGAVAMPPGNAQACSDDACGTGQSQAIAVLPAGRYYLVVSGVGGQKGDATIHFEHSPIGRHGAQFLPPGSSTITGTLSGTGTLFRCEAAGNDTSYYWASCLGFPGGTVAAGTCDNTPFDSLLTLHIPRNGVGVCADDGCGLQSRLNANLPAGAGLHVLSVDSSSPVHAGPFTLTVTRP